MSEPMCIFGELARIEALARRSPIPVDLRLLTTVAQRGRRFPVYGLVFGDADRTRPVFGLFAGVHGLERIGSHIALTFLESFMARLRWDREAQRALQRCRLVAIPVVNPAGVYYRQRANARGVDLMRNAPVTAEVQTPLLFGGHRLSRLLPWFRGNDGELEAEASALIDFVRQELFCAPAALALDIHSGFGLRDRLWYPYAKTTATFPEVARVRALSDLLDRNLPHHVYLIEQQSNSYTAHGDLWDFLYDEHAALPSSESVFLPWTLEIGSWSWIRKNPWQLLVAEGPYDPVKPHRYARVMRRHLGLLDFFFRAARNYRRWLRSDPARSLGAG